MSIKAAQAAVFSLLGIAVVVLVFAVGYVFGDRGEDSSASTPLTRPPPQIPTPRTSPTSTKSTMCSRTNMSIRISSTARRSISPPLTACSRRSLIAEPFMSTSRRWRPASVRPESSKASAPPWPSRTARSSSSLRSKIRLRSARVWSPATSSSPSMGCRPRAGPRRRRSSRSAARRAPM